MVGATGGFVYVAQSLDIRQAHDRRLTSSIKKAICLASIDLILEINTELIQHMTSASGLEGRC